MDIQGQGDRITRVNKYQIGPTLGEGTFGKVKQAKNIVTGEVVAMKILDKDRILRNHMADQLKMEISMMKKLRHDNIVQLIEVLTSKTKVFIVLELASGGELFQKIANATRFNEETARLYFRQLVRGVEFCHSLGICHRDLKPENLLLDEKGTLKISDFGLCALADREDQLLKTQCGTPNYTAPEILLGKKYDGKPTDVWSCGVILFVMLAGYLPFEEQTSQELFKKIKAAQYNFPSFFPAGPKPLIQRILVVDPNRRYTLAQIKQDPWFLAGVPYDDSKDLKNLSKLADVKVSSSDMAHALESIDDSELQTKGGQGGKKGVDASGPQKKGPGQVVNPTFAAASGGVGATKQEDQQLPAVAGTMQRKAVGAPIDQKKPTTLNAFELIAASGALDITPILDADSRAVRVKRDTIFSTTQGAELVMKRIEDELKKLPGQIKHSNQFKMRIAMPMPGGIMTAKIEVFMVTTNLHLIDVRRGKGSVLDFYRWYKQFRISLNDISPYNPEFSDQVAPPSARSQQILNSLNQRQSQSNMQSSSGGQYPQRVQQQQQYSQQQVPQQGQKPQYVPQQQGQQGQSYNQGSFSNPYGPQVQSGSAPQQQQGGQPQRMSPQQQQSPGQGQGPNPNAKPQMRQLPSPGSPQGVPPNIRSPILPGQGQPQNRPQGGYQ